MSDLNHVILIGRLTRDAEPSSGNGPTKISIAVNRRKKQGDQWIEEASFFMVDYWHKTILPYLVKGKQIAVEGELVQDRWTDAEGKPRSSVKVNALNIQLLGGGQGEAQQGQGGRSSPMSPTAFPRPSSGTARPNPEPVGDECFADDVPW